MLEVLNEGGGTTFILNENDSLDDVPESHRDIIDDDIQIAFTDPVTYFRKVAERSRLQNFAKWLWKMIADANWELVFADTYMMHRVTVGAFRWSDQADNSLAPSILAAMVAPGAVPPNPSKHHPDFDALYSLVTWFHWGDIGFSGGLIPPNGQLSLKNYGMQSKSKKYPSDTSIVFGATSCGDSLIHNAKGEAGFFSHECGTAYSLGSIPESLEWVFGELLEGREPLFDYDRIK